MTVFKRSRKRKGRAKGSRVKPAAPIERGRTPPLCAGIGAHIGYVESQLANIGNDLLPGEEEIKSKAHEHLRTAKEEIKPRRWNDNLWRRLVRADVVAALSNVHEAEVELIKLLKGRELKSRVPEILTQARDHLPPDDQQRQFLEKEWSKTGVGQDLTEEARGAAVGTLHSANAAREAERLRLRSFTQILSWSILLTSLIAVIFGVWASVDTDVANLFCFRDQSIPEARNCPLGANASGSDVFLIEFMGMFAATLAGAASLREMRGNSSPFHISVLLLLLRLPVGAMTAVLGILLVSGAFFPGLTSLDTSAQIIAWAAAFGIVQEAVTRAVDKTGRSFLDELAAVEGPETQRRKPARHHGKR